MSLRFRVFRQVLCFLFIVLSAVSLCLGTYLFSYFFRRGVIWMLVIVEVSSCVRSFWSLLRKPVLASPQSVASEVVGLFVLFPFQLIVTLLLFSIRPRSSMPAGTFMALKLFSVSGALIHMVYTLALVAVAMLTVPAFDSDVWLRDLDSSPSPFPLAIIFGYAFPCIARLFETTRPFARESEAPAVDPPVAECLPTCFPNCIIHGIRQVTVPKPAEGSASPTNPPTEEAKRPPILPHTLIRIPNAAERRSSIYVDLNFRTRI
ncbi:hypothetical protein BDN70DRAFT_503827 [Pholiota conissans]|uniref:Transmembrane protein n=1 Tax=Pholiota conissans TaxID=109636 RepID=A0A9P5YP46_9AGAR|nr:hypothetical protein BDN70DRAFT_503827 [Pholiota conissans]